MAWSTRDKWYLQDGLARRVLGTVVEAASATHHKIWRYIGYRKRFGGVMNIKEHKSNSWRNNKSTGSEFSRNSRQQFKWVWMSTPCIPIFRRTKCLCDAFFRRCSSNRGIYNFVFPEMQPPPQPPQWGMFAHMSSPAAQVSADFITYSISTKVGILVIRAY